MIINNITIIFILFVTFQTSSLFSLPSKTKTHKQTLNGNIQQLELDKKEVKPKLVDSSAELQN